VKVECPDIELLTDLKKNNFSAFNTIYAQYSKPLYVYLLHKLKDPEVCNDVLQDIFVSFWEKKEQLNIEISIKAYLFQAARYKIIDLYRLDIKYQKYLADLAEFMTIDESVITDRIDNRRKLQEIEHAVNNLPEKMREIFILSRYEHQTTRDIATKTNLSPQTVKNQLSKALRILRISYMSVDIILLVLFLNLYGLHPMLTHFRGF
jgi:RNA polymerase sigma-70 factor (family 1)